MHRFPSWEEDKRTETSKIFLSLFTLFLYYVTISGEYSVHYQYLMWSSELYPSLQDINILSRYLPRLILGNSTNLWEKSFVSKKSWYWTYEYWIVGLIIYKIIANMCKNYLAIMFHIILNSIKTYFCYQIVNDLSLLYVCTFSSKNIASHKY